MKILIVGAGKSGQWAVKLAKEKGIYCDVYDDRDINILDKEFVAYCQTNGFKVFSVRDWPNLGVYDLAVISPGVPPKNPVYNALLSSKVKMVSEVEFAYLYCEGVVVGITGSNGKTTVTGLTNHILNSAGLKSLACGNFGTPFSKALFENNYKGYFVVELSSFQLELIDKFKPQTAALLNLSPDHLDRYESCDEYYKAKLNIFKNVEKEEFCFINGEDEETKRFESFFSSKFTKISSLNNGFSVDDNQVKFENSKFIDFNDTKLKGKHNLFNIAFAASLAKSLTVSLEKIKQGIKTFSPISHRLEFVREINGVEFYNDSKATNFDAVLKALSSFDSIHLIAGGMYKGGDFASLRSAAFERVKQFYIIGKDTKLFYNEFSNDFKCEDSQNMETAIKNAYKNAQPGDVVLLAPGTASFDQFENYEKRGDFFKKIVMELI